MHSSPSSTKFQWVMMLLLLGLTMAGAYEGPFSELEIDEQLKILNKPAVKTIYTKHGDIFDCINIYEQPAFDHPLLRNHTLQLKPTSYPKLAEDKVGPISSNASYGWLNELLVKCPQGTVPLRRVTKEDLLRARSLSKSIESPGTTPMSNSKACPYEYKAGLFTVPGAYYGARANFNIWDPNVPDPNGYSGAEISIANKGHYVQSGWMVYPALFNDAKARIFGRWTDDKFESTGCFNNQCPGFVQTGHFPLGFVLDPVSSFGDGNHQVEQIFQIFRDPVTHNWWLEVTNIDIKIGYWPREVVQNLGDGGADSIYWGGELCAPDDSDGDFYMGSGNFPSAGYTNAAYINMIQYVVQDGNSVRQVDVDSDKIFTEANKPQCFDVSDHQYRGDWGVYVFYGGRSEVGIDSC